jgi:hypothetical protein
MNELFTVKKNSIKTNFIYFLAIALIFPFFVSTEAHSAQPIDCINVDSANLVENSYVTYDYVLQISSLCRLNSISDVDSISGTSISLELRGPQVVRKSSSIGNLTYGQKITFQLGNLKDGIYSPSLRLSKAGQSTRTINLPNFTVSNILECIKVTRSFTEEISNTPSLKVYLRNTCMTYSENEFSSFNIKMQFVSDFNSLGLSEVIQINRLSSSESLFIFKLDSLSPGIYMTSSVKVFTPSKSRELLLDIFAISKKGSNPTTPSPSPTKSSTSKNPLEDIQQCSTSKGFDESCTYAPDWYFEFCAVHLEGSLEQKIGSTWKSVKKVKASRTDKSCGKNFNLFGLEGVSNSATKKLTFRVQLFATSKYKQSSILFYVTPKLVS